MLCWSFLFILSQKYISSLFPTMILMPSLYDLDSDCFVISIVDIVIFTTSNTIINNINTIVNWFVLTLLYKNRPFRFRFFISQDRILTKYFKHFIGFYLVIIPFKQQYSI